MKLTGVTITAAMAIAIPIIVDPMTRSQLDRAVQLLNLIEKKGTLLMSVITDWAAKESADLTAIKGSLDTIVTGVKRLDDLITALQNSSSLSAADQAALDAIQSQSKILVSQAAAIDTTAPVAPATPAV